MPDEIDDIIFGVAENSLNPKGYEYNKLYHGRKVDILIKRLILVFKDKETHTLCEDHFSDIIDSSDDNLQWIRGTSAYYCEEYHVRDDPDSVWVDKKRKFVCFCRDKDVSEDKLRYSNLLSRNPSVFYFKIYAHGLRELNMKYDIIQSPGITCHVHPDGHFHIFDESSFLYAFLKRSNLTVIDDFKDSMSSEARTLFEQSLEHSRRSFEALSSKKRQNLERRLEERFFKYYTSMGEN